MNNRKTICYVLATFLFLSACNSSSPISPPRTDNSCKDDINDSHDLIYESEKQRIVVPYRSGYIDEDKVYDVVDKMPVFPGGYEKLKEYLEDNMQYPKKLKGSGIQGRVIVTFVVEKNGIVSKAKVVKSIDSALDKEALRLVNNMPRWIPGKQNDIHVNVKYTLPIIFKEQ